MIDKKQSPRLHKCSSGHYVRVIFSDGEPWFRLADVERMTHGFGGQVERLTGREVKQLKLGESQMTCVNSTGLLALSPRDPNYFPARRSMVELISAFVKKEKKVNRKPEQ